SSDLLAQPVDHTSSCFSFFWGTLSPVGEGILSPPPFSSPNKSRHGELTLITLWQGDVNFIKGDS
ncbi:hypothetical protein, partial [Enterobacter cloacae]|uniref:hypothetical protein n=1 Tax=Enterobacter cloacae TaxID=550 RepID=UPI0020759151